MTGGAVWSKDSARLYFETDYTDEPYYELPRTDIYSIAVNGGAPSPTQTIRMAVGCTLQVQDNDVMPHQLVLVSGPHAQLAGAAMDHMGASSTVTFPKAGTYVLTTKAGEDYTKGIKTIGADNKLQIKVLAA